MDQLSAEGILYNLYDKVDGHGLSRQVKLDNPHYGEAFNYGEIDFHSFYDILLQTTPQPDEVFYDLGSGTGKAVSLAALAFPFTKCIGVEKLNELHIAATETTRSLQQKQILLINDDFLNIDFTNGDVIYLNSYFFNKEIQNKSFIRQVESLKPGTRIIFVHTPLVIPSLSLIYKSNYLFSWGNATVYIMKKT